jgi:toxin ParE1/3/4
MGYRLSPRAATDLDDIWFYIAKESGSMETANRFADSVTDQFSVLARHPRLGRARDEDFGTGLRSFPTGEYIIIYCVQNDDVLILRVVHGRRDLEFLFEP